MNQSGITKTSCVNIKQILADVNLQSSVGCIVPQSLGVSVGVRKVVKAGTPININLENLSTASKAVASGAPMNAVVLHDVDVTAGNGNGTALTFGFINLNRVDTDVATAISTARAVTGASPLLTFMKA